MEKNTLKLCYCFADSLNLHGDLGNIMAFEKVTKMLGAEFDFSRINSFYDDFTIDEYDILFFSPGELRTAINMASVLKEKRDMFVDYLDKGKTIIVIGTTIALFSKNILRSDGKVYPGHDIVDVSIRERNITYSNDEVFTMNLYGNELKIYGGQIQMADVLIHDEQSLGKVTYGYGNCHKEDEGLVKNGFIFTNALGPVFVKNPAFAASIIIKILKDKGSDLELTMPEFAFEDASNKRIQDFIDLKIEKYDASRLEK